MAWKIEFERSAAKALEKLDAQAARRIVRYLQEVRDLSDPRSRGKGLAASKSGLWRYRVGDYRVVCKIEDDRLLILVVRLGHRSVVYDD